MKHITLFLCLYALAAYGQSAAPQAPPSAKPATPQSIPPDTVVLKVAGKPFTAAEFAKLMATFPPEYQQAARNNPAQVMQSYFLMKELARQAEEEKLDQVSPVKESLELQRMQGLATAVVNRYQAGISTSDEDVQKYYDEHKDKKYSQAKIKGILITFGGEGGINAQVDMSDIKNPKTSIPRNLREERDAKKLAEDLSKQIREGGDFAALAKGNSDDKVTAAKGGEFPILHETDRMPENIKQAVFSIKPGEVSEPIRMQTGYYIFKLIERTNQPLAEIKQIVANDLKQERFQKWAGDAQKRFVVTVENPAYFGAPPVAAPQSGMVPSTRPAQATPTR